MGFFNSLISGAINIATSIANTLAPVLKQVVGQLLPMLANAFAAFFRELGLINLDEKTTELGDKALQAEMDEENPIRPENYDLYSEYVDAVKKYTPDPELSNRLSPAEKERKGMELGAGLAIEKYGKPMLDLLVFVCQHPEKFADGQWLSNLGKAINDDKSIMEPVANYITHKKQSVGEDDKAFEAMERIEKAISPDAADTVIWETIKQRAAG